MKKNRCYRLLSLSLALFLLNSCSVEIKSEIEQVTTVVNLTENEILYVEESRYLGEENFNLLLNCNPCDSVSEVEVLESNAYLHFGIAVSTDMSFSEKFIGQIELFNITDTTSYLCACMKSEHYTSSDCFFVNNYYSKESVKLKKHYEQVTYKTIVDDDLLEIFEKDYTMLERFSVFY